MRTGTSSESESRKQAVYKGSIKMIGNTSNPGNDPATIESMRCHDIERREVFSTGCTLLSSPRDRVVHA